MVGRHAHGPQPDRRPAGCPRGARAGDRAPAARSRIRSPSATTARSRPRPAGSSPSATEARTVEDDPTDSTCSLSSPNAQIHTVAVPAGTTYARFSLFDDFTDGADDLDLCVFNAAGTKSARAAAGRRPRRSTSSTRRLATTGRRAGLGHGWPRCPVHPVPLGARLHGGREHDRDRADDRHDRRTGTISLTFSGLAAATKYLGSVAYSGTDGMPNPTIVRVDTP